MKPINNNTMSQVEKDKNIMEAEFYSKPFFFSYSSLNRLLTAPALFYKEYVMQEKEPKTEKHLLEGTLIHYLLLEHKDFDKKFLVSTDNLPSDNSIKVVNHIFDIYKSEIELDAEKEGKSLSDYQDEIDEKLKEMDLHQNVKDRTKRIEKIVEPKSIAYFEFLRVKESREIIDSAMLDRCTLAADLIKLNLGIRDLLGMDREMDQNKFMVYNEIELRAKLPNFPFGLKGVIDNLTVDVEQKLIRINDFKTTHKGLANFPDTVDYWRYWLQAVIYMLLVQEFLKSIIDDTWKIEIRFIVFDENDQIYAFPVSVTTLTEWFKRYLEVLKQANYHYESRDFTLPYKFAIGEATL